MIKLQDENRVELAYRTLALLTAVRASLTAEAMCHALGLAHVLDKQVLDKSKPSKVSKEEIPDFKSVIECCMGLIKMEPTTNTVKVAHYDILQEMRKRWVQLFAPEHTTRLARTCVTYISLSEFSKGPCHETDTLQRRLQEYPFLAYASRHWSYHARVALSLGTSEADVSDDVHWFLEQPMNLASSLQASECEQEGKRKNLSAVYADKVSGVPKLQLASRYGLITIVEGLLEENPDKISAQDPYGRTALHEAAQTGWDDVVIFLQEAGAKSSLEDYQGKTPFDYAAECGQAKIISILERCQYGSQAQQAAPLEFQITRSRHDLKKLEEALCEAAEADRPDVVQKLLELDVHPHAGMNNISVVTVAASRGHESVVRLLLEASKSLPDLDGSSSDSIPLHQAIRNGYVNIAALLPGSRANIQTRDNSGRTALFESLNTSDVRGASLLLRNGIDISCHNSMGNTVLHEAARRGTYGHALLFINQGIEISIANEEGLTPLHLAARHGCYAIANLLVRKGAAVDHCDSNGQTPLMYAPYPGHTQVSEMLLRLGASMNAMGRGQDAPSISTGESGRRWDSQVLNETGVDVDVTGLKAAKPSIKNRNLRVSIESTYGRIQQ